MLNHPRGTAVRRSPDRGDSIIGIKLPSRSIEDVALTDGACRDLPALTEMTDDSGAAARECHVARNEFRPAADDPDARKQPDAICSSSI